MFGRNLTQISVKTALICALTIAICSEARAGTATVNFGWEDGTSTVLGEFISGGVAGVSYANVTMGSEVDYGPTAEPFDPPVEYNPVPFGSRMLEINIDPVDEGDSDAVRPFLGYVENLDDGDIIQYSFKYYDPSDGRSPSVLVDGVYGQNGDINSFAGFFTPFQCFAPGGGAWLDVIGDAACDDMGPFPVDPNMVFDAGDMGDREAVILRARPFRPSLSTIPNGGSGSYKFYLDDLRIQVTSDNPDAQITLPDGSVTLVNSIVVDGDFNNDGFWDFQDINALTAAIATESDDLSFDMNGDGDITIADLEDEALGWLTVGGANNIPDTGGNPFLTGDANLDGVADGQDFIEWNGNKFTDNTNWSDGNFNADLVIDGQDFIAWNENKFMSSSNTLTAVPEPGTGLLALLFGLGIAFTRRNRS